MYAEAAVDGSTRRSGRPTDAARRKPRPVDLGAARRIGDRGPLDRHAAVARSIQTSLDGSTWTRGAGGRAGKLRMHGPARYVRVTLTRSGDERTGIRELEVTG